jgi:hypothetical protein
MKRWYWTPIIGAAMYFRFYNTTKMKLYVPFLSR